MEEVQAVGTAEGIDLPEDLVDSLMPFTKGASSDAYSSLCHDLTDDKPM